MEMAQAAGRAADLPPKDPAESRPRLPGSVSRELGSRDHAHLGRG